ncbi:MAG: hypothetical protein ACI4OI_02160, partial [Gemmiger sp.]
PDRYHTGAIRPEKPIVQRGRAAQHGNESGTAGTAKNDFAPVSQRHSPLRDGFFLPGFLNRHTKPQQTPMK